MPSIKWYNAYDANFTCLKKKGVRVCSSNILLVNTLKSKIAENCELWYNESNTKVVEIVILPSITDLLRSQTKWIHVKICGIVSTDTYRDSIDRLAIY